MISEGIGSGLYFQNGPNPLTDAVPVPSEESTIQQTLWGQGKCVPRLGGSTSNLKYHLHPLPPLYASRTKNNEMF